MATGTEQPPLRRYHFGDFILDLDRGFLRLGEQDVPLRPKSFEVLSYLVERHGRLVSKSGLIRAVWHDSAVTDNSLSQCLSEIRHALGDSDQKMLRTIKGRGYVFAAPLNPHVEGQPANKTAADPESELRRGRSSVPVPWALAILCMLGLCIAVLMGLHRANSRGDSVRAFQPLTDFTDSAVAPAISADGRMVAFFRSDKWWLTRDPIYLKMLPNGEPARLTDDPRMKCCLAFSPDGSQVAYTAYDPGQSGWRTFTVPTHGGEPKLLQANATGLTWLDPRRLLFSEVRTGFHMGVVSAAPDRSGLRTIYFPNDERAMIHFSFPSPDRRWAILVEMNPDWRPCRLIPLDGSSRGRQVGPIGSCTSAGWSPDGDWMYFGAEIAGGRHLWRQRLHGGDPEQITFGPTEEEGIAMDPNGRSLITSLGKRQTAIWMHDASGERPLSTDGEVVASAVHGVLPKFSRNGESIYYLKRRMAPATGNELWRTDTKSGTSEPVIAGVSMLEYDISDDETKAVYSARPAGTPSELWLSSLDRSAPPQMIASSGESLPFFSRDGRIVFQYPEADRQYVGGMDTGGTNRVRVSTQPVDGLLSISADRKWVAAVARLPGESYPSTIAIPISGGDVRRICPAYCPVAWAPDGRFLFIGLRNSSHRGQGQTVALPLLPEEGVPSLPSGGIQSFQDVERLRGSRILDAWELSPGTKPFTFAFVKTTMQRNLFRIPVRGN